MNIQSYQKNNAQSIYSNAIKSRAKQKTSFNNAQTFSERPAFKGTGLLTSQAMRFLATNMAWGAIFVDLFCMDTPRTVVDFCKRGANAGTETGIREGSGTTNHSLIGTYGLGAAAVAAVALNNKYGVKTNDIFASNETVDYLGNIWHEELKNKNIGVETPSDYQKPLKEFLNKVVPDIEGFVSNGEKSEWVKLPKDASDNIVAKFNDYITKMANGTATKADKKAIKSFIKSEFGTSIGTDNAMRFSKLGTDVSDSMHADTMISNITKLAKSFMSEKVQAEMIKAEKFDAVDFIKGLKHLNRNVAIGGLAIASAIGMSIQPLNRLHTKLKTGSDEFVGGGKTDKSAKFKVLKFTAAAAFALGAIATITTHPSKLLSKIQFKGISPTIDQFKLIYGLTIASRLASSRTNDELRESTIKDTLGFANWLILGNFVSIGVAKLFEKGTKMNFLKYHNPEHKNWLLNSSIISRDEVLFDSLKKEAKGLSFSEMVKRLPKGDIAKTKLRYLNIIQLAGYIYSGLVLGIGIPRLNIAIKEHKDKKRAELAKQNGQTIAQATPKTQASAKVVTK